MAYSKCSINGSYYYYLPEYPPFIYLYLITQLLLECSIYIYNNFMESFSRGKASVCIFCLHLVSLVNTRLSMPQIVPAA